MKVKIVTKLAKTFSRSLVMIVQGLRTLPKAYVRYLNTSMFAHIYLRI